MIVLGGAEVAGVAGVARVAGVAGVTRVAGAAKGWPGCLGTKETTRHWAHTFKFL
jgi:hypothetical protein